MLGRVAISRVFDIEGVWEVLSEISADCQSPLPGQELSNSAEKLTEGPDQILGQINAAAGTARNIAPKLEVEAERENELEIKDSEAEEDDEDIEEVDISHTGNTDLLQDINNAPDSLGTSIPSADPTLRAKPPEGKGQIEIIIIDSMTSPISELFSHRERTSGKFIARSGLYHPPLPTHVISANHIHVLQRTHSYPPSPAPFTPSAIPTTSSASSSTLSTPHLHEIPPTTPHPGSPPNQPLSSPRQPPAPPSAASSPTSAPSTCSSPKSPKQPRTQAHYTPLHLLQVPPAPPSPPTTMTMTMTKGSHKRALLYEIPSRRYNRMQLSLLILLLLLQCNTPPSSKS